MIGDLVKFIRADLQRIVAAREHQILKHQCGDYAEYMYLRGQLDTAAAALEAFEEAVVKYKKSVINDSE